MMRCNRSEPEARTCWHYSGILVLARPAEVSACIGHLERLAGVEVHQNDPKTGRIIAVLETTSLEEQENLLQSVRLSPRVLLAELVYYRRDEEPDAALPEANRERWRTGA